MTFLALEDGLTVIHFLTFLKCPEKTARLWSLGDAPPLVVGTLIVHQFLSKDTDFDLTLRVLPTGNVEKMIFVPLRPEMGPP